MADSPTKYQTSVESSPVDAHGQSLCVFDIVRILSLPDWYTSDSNEDFVSSMAEYVGCFALIKYSPWPDIDGIRRWYGKNDMLIVQATKCGSDFVTVYEFTIPPSMVERVPFNIAVMNLFTNYDWDIHRAPSKLAEDDYRQEWNVGLQGVIDFPINSGTKHFNLLSAISRAPQEKLQLIQSFFEEIFPELRHR